MEIRAYLDERRRLVEGALAGVLPPTEESSEPLTAAMRYSVLGGGKRLRPILCLAAVEALGGDVSQALPAACALELVHSYSLIHDDLPCMDDDDLRRGKPTTHRAFGEAVAVLAGDALLTLAFELISEAAEYDAGKRIELVRLLSRAAGPRGLVGGQAADCAFEGREATPEVLDYIHSRKTAGFFEVSVIFGAVLAAAATDEREALSRYGRRLGMAFQITDDILDVEGEERRLGKTVGKDAKARKATYPALYGLDGARERAASCIEEAVAALGRFDARADPLRGIARAVLERKG